MTESIVWTALPHGVDASPPNVLQLTVFLALRLTPGVNPSLNSDDAPDFSHWTELAEAANRQFQVRFRADTPGAAAIELGLFTPLPQSFRPDLWPALFANAEVRERQIEPIAERAQVTGASADVFTTVQRQYQRAALRRSTRPFRCQRMTASTPSSGRSALRFSAMTARRSSGARRAATVT